MRRNVKNRMWSTEYHHL